MKSCTLTILLLKGHLTNSDKKTYDLTFNRETRISCNLTEEEVVNVVDTIIKHSYLLNEAIKLNGESKVLEEYGFQEDWREPGRLINSLEGISDFMADYMDTEPVRREALAFKILSSSSEEYFYEIAVKDKND